MHIFMSLKLNQNITFEEKIWLGIPYQYKNLNSFQLYIQWIYSENPSFDEKQKRQEILNKLISLEESKIQKNNSFISSSIQDFKQLYIENSELLKKSFNDFVENFDYQNNTFFLTEVEIYVLKYWFLKLKDDFKENFKLYQHILNIIQNSYL